MNNCRTIIEVREYVTDELTKMGFSVLPSRANFIFAKHDDISGFDLYDKLKKRGVLVRHFTKERIKDYNRITVGTPEQMSVFLDKVKEILNDIQK